MKNILFILLCFPILGFTQQEIHCHPSDSSTKLRVILIPKVMTADSLMHHIYSFNSSKYGIEYKRKFGWLKLSDKFDTDEFYQMTKQYCIDRVGEQYFYDNFRIDWRSFKDEANNEIYYIRYYFFLPDVEYDHVRITFKKYSFYGIVEIELPDNLPDCSLDNSLCQFLVNREKARRIIENQLLKERDLKIYIKELNTDFKWVCALSSEGNWYNETFTIDARTGEISEIQIERRID